MKIKQLSLIAICFTAKNSFGATLTKLDQPGSQYVATASDNSKWSCKLDRKKYDKTEFQNSSYNPSNYPILGDIASNASSVIDGMDTSAPTQFQCKKQAGVNDECYAPIYYPDAPFMGAPIWKIRALICNKLDNDNKILPVAHPNK